MIVPAAVVWYKISLFNNGSPSLFDLKTFCLFSDLSEFNFEFKNFVFNFVIVCISVDKLLKAKKTCRLRIIV